MERKTGKSMWDDLALFKILITNPAQAETFHTEISEEKT